MGQTTFSGPVRSLAGFNPSGFDTVVNFDGTTASTSLTVADHGGRILTVNDADHTFILPAIVGTEPALPSTVESADQTCNLGATFRFFIATSATDVNINTDGTDKYLGALGTVLTNATGNKWFHAVTGDSFDAIDLNGTTKGGIDGSYIEIQAVAADTYSVKGVLLASGVLATPFATS